MQFIEVWSKCSGCCLKVVRSDIQPLDYFTGSFSYGENVDILQKTSSLSSWQSSRPSQRRSFSTHKPVVHRKWPSEHAGEKEVTVSVAICVLIHKNIPYLINIIHSRFVKCIVMTMIWRQHCSDLTLADVEAAVRGAERQLGAAGAAAKHHLYTSLRNAEDGRVTHVAAAVSAGWRRRSRSRAVINSSSRIVIVTLWLNVLTLTWPRWPSTSRVHRESGLSVTGCSSEISEPRRAKCCGSVMSQRTSVLHNNNNNNKPPYHNRKDIYSLYNNDTDIVFLILLICCRSIWPMFA